MADYMNGYDNEYEFEEEEDDIITAEDCWTVISSFFEKHGLVSQQLDSYNEFVTKTINDIVADKGKIILDQNTPQYFGDEDPIVKKRFEIEFGRLIIGP